MTYIVQVIADNKEPPHITPEKLTVEIDEETPGIIDISGTTITVQDRDAVSMNHYRLPRLFKDSVRTAQ